MSKRAKEFCRQVVDHMLRLRGILSADRAYGARMAAYVGCPHFREAADDIFHELAGARDPEIAGLYCVSFAMDRDPKWVAETIQNRIWDR
jgi:hypothetical protein